MNSWVYALLLLIRLNSINTAGLPAAQVAEQALMTSLLTGYNKNIRPDSHITIDITTSIQQIITIDEKQQIMTSSLFIAQSWTDERLSWTPNATNYNIEVLLIPSRSLWIPDTMILNSADSSGYLTVSEYSLSEVEYTGDVYMVIPSLTVRTRCSLYVKKFPFDDQICPINLTSWSQGSNRLEYIDNGSTVVDLYNYLPHPLWELTGVDVIVLADSDRSRFEESENDVISIKFFLKRKPLFFMMNGIFACLILNAVTLLSYALPFGSQVGLCMTCFMTYSVYSLNFSNLFPQQSEYLMLITLYFLLSICWTLISMVWFTLCNHYITQSKMSKKLDQFANKLQQTPAKLFSRKKVNDSSSSTEPVKTVTTGTQQTTTIITLMGIDQPVEPKCGFCNRCKACQTDSEKDKNKTKMKKDIESKCNTLNNFLFVCMFMTMFISNMVVWFIMAQ